MNGFRKLQNELRDRGWTVEWDMPCCQSCAWSAIGWDHPDADLSKVLFNHEQDCQEDLGECTHCLGEGWMEEAGEECQYCDGSGCNLKQLSPEEQNWSMFCFDGTDKGVENLKKILPIIEECGCRWEWNQTGSQRIEIGWR